MSFYFVFEDFQKNFLVWWAFKKTGIKELPVKTVKSLYRNV